MKETLVFWEEEEAYGARFMAYVERKGLLAGHMMRVRSREELLALAREEGLPVLLAEESAWAELAEEEKQELEDLSRRVLLLAESGGEGPPKRICRYQPIPRLIRCLSEACGESLAGQPEAREGTRIFLVCAPGGSDHLSACACTLAHILSERGRTLFLSLEAFPGFSLPEEECEGLSELLYKIRSGSPPGPLEQVTLRLGELAVIPPAANPRDIWELQPEEERRLMNALREAGGFEQIVLALDGGRDPGAFLPFGSCLVIPTMDTPDGRRQKERFLHYLLESGEDVPEQLKEFPVPEIPELSDLSAADPALKYSRLGECLRELLPGEKRIAERTEIE